MKVSPFDEVVKNAKTAMDRWLDDLPAIQLRALRRKQTMPDENVFHRKADAKSAAR